MMIRDCKDNNDNYVYDNNIKHNNNDDCDKKHLLCFL